MLYSGRFRRHSAHAQPLVQQQQQVPIHGDWVEQFMELKIVLPAMVPVLKKESLWFKVDDREYSRTKRLRILDKLAKWFTYWRPA